MNGSRLPIADPGCTNHGAHAQGRVLLMLPPLGPRAPPCRPCGCRSESSEPLAQFGNTCGAAIPLSHFGGIGLDLRPQRARCRWTATALRICRNLEQVLLAYQGVSCYHMPRLPVVPRAFWHRSGSPSTCHECRRNKHGPPYRYTRRPPNSKCLTAHRPGRRRRTTREAGCRVGAGKIAKLATIFESSRRSH